MLETLRTRVAGVLILLGLLFGLSVWYGALPPAPNLGAYPSDDELHENFGVYVGDRVTVEGEVVEADPLVIVSSNGAEDPLRLHVIDVRTSVNQGMELVVYGAATEDRTIRAIEMVVVPSWGLWYTYSISFLAGLWVLARLLTGWRADGGTTGLVPRVTARKRHSSDHTMISSSESRGERDA